MTITFTLSDRELASIKGFMPQESSLSEAAKFAFIEKCNEVGKWVGEIGALSEEDQAAVKECLIDQIIKAKASEYN